MSSQNDTGIPLAHAPNGQSYKLLELPAEVLSLLESDSPPVLSLESSEHSAVLKHGDKAWGLRQKNTSNALMLLSPSEAKPPGSEIPQPGLKVVATVYDTIELVPEGQGSSGVVPTTKGKWHEKFARGR